MILVRAPLEHLGVRERCLNYLKHGRRRRGRCSRQWPQLHAAIDSCSYEGEGC